MYLYDDFDRQFVLNRIDQFRQQVKRRIEGSLTEDEFKPLRLMNGLYLQLHAYMLRVAIPYGTLDSRKMRRLAYIADRWDKGYGHFTTRQNIQFNWPRLADVPDILKSLAEVEMHAIQTSGNCVRNVTADHFAGAAADEVADPRPTAELLRQWSTDHPEFAFLPRKFKIAVTGSPADRAVIRAHDIGLYVVRNNAGETGYEVFVGGGLGRTPVIGHKIRDFLPEPDLLPYIEAILQVYNALGRRDNKYRARIKILLQELGLDTFRQQVEDQFVLRKTAFQGAHRLLFKRISLAFSEPDFITAPIGPFLDSMITDPVFRTFAERNLHPHRNPDYAIVTISLKAHGQTPGDATSDQMRIMADLAAAYSHDELRISHEQNVILPHVHKGDLPEVHAMLAQAGLATPNIGLASDIIACPGMDYCNLATARSIPVAKEIALKLDRLGLEHEIGPLKIKISGCINACGHHHVGHIGILGLDRSGVENYQITLGGDGTRATTLGDRAGPGFSSEDLLPAIERLLGTYLTIRESRSESFLETYRRVGMAPFREALYPSARRSAAE